METERPLSRRARAPLLEKNRAVTARLDGSAAEIARQVPTQAQLHAGHGPGESVGQRGPGMDDGVPSEAFLGPRAEDLPQMVVGQGQYGLVLELIGPASRPIPAEGVMPQRLDRPGQGQRADDADVDLG